MWPICVELEDEDCGSREARQEPEGQHQTADGLGQRDQRDPENRGVPANFVEDFGEFFEAGAAEPTKQFLAAMRTSINPITSRRNGRAKGSNA
jgi:hypothetical protein